MPKILLQLTLPLLLGFFANGLIAQAQSGAGETPVEINSEIRELLLRSQLEINGVEILTRGIMLDLYRDNGFSPYWVHNRDILELLDLIEHSPDHGLSPADYNFEELRSILAERNRNRSTGIGAESEILLSESLLRYGYHRRLGKVNARKLDPDINFKRHAFRNQPPGDTMREILAAPTLKKYIAMVAPSGPYYRKIQYWLDYYRDIEGMGGWPAVPVGPTLRRGDSDPRVVIVRSRLAASGDLRVNMNPGSPEFDAALDTAVSNFQARHALDADGVVGKQTLAAMNVSVDYRIEQLRASLERLRWVNQEAADTLVAVNIAGFQALFIKDGELTWTTRAMVGKTYRRTPVFRGDIAYMEFNPTWTIPPTILAKDTLPAIKRDPNYLASKNIRVIDRNGGFVDPATVEWSRYSKGVPYTLRQDPGPTNALGTVKFIFPNEHFVFLHDTPHRELFDRPERAFSSGCIRIEDPMRLAELLLADPEQYPRTALEGIVASRKTQRISLKPKVPVIIVYLTAALDDSGNIMFLNDIYNRDKRVIEALNGIVTIDPTVTGP